MKVLKCIFLLSLLCIVSITAKSTTLPLTLKNNNIEVEAETVDIPKTILEHEDDQFGTLTVRICYQPNFGVRRCITVTITVSVKTLIEKDLNVKASMSKDGQTLTFSNLPSKLNDGIINIKKAEFSGYLLNDQKMFLKAGRYKISKGQATIKLAKK